MSRQPFAIAIACLSILIALAGCAPSPMARNCNERRTIIEGTISSE